MDMFHPGLHIGLKFNEFAYLGGERVECVLAQDAQAGIGAF